MNEFGLIGVINLSLNDTKRHEKPIIAVQLHSAHLKTKKEENE